MDEIDLGLHELSSQLADTGVFKDSTLMKSSKTNSVGNFTSSVVNSRYAILMKKYMFYWTTALTLFVFILWASPEYCYITTRTGSSRQFSWSRFFTVFIVLYSTIIGLHITSTWLS